jgi:hypothetical protein
MLADAAMYGILTWYIEAVFPGRQLDTTLCDKVCQWLVAGRLFSLGIPVTSTNKTDCHNKPESGIKHYKHKPRYIIILSSTDQHVYAQKKLT